MDSREVQQLTRRKISPRYQTYSTEGAPGPPEASDVREMMVVDRAPFPMGRKRRPLSKVIGQPFDSLKPIYVCRTYYAAHALGTYLQSLLKKRPIGR